MVSGVQGLGFLSSRFPDPYKVLGLKRRELAIQKSWPCPLRPETRSVQPRLRSKAGVQRSGTRNQARRIRCSFAGTLRCSNMTNFMPSYAVHKLNTSHPNTRAQLRAAAGLPIRHVGCRVLLRISVDSKTNIAKPCHPYKLKTTASQSGSRTQGPK